MGHSRDTEQEIKGKECDVVERQPRGSCGAGGKSSKGHGLRDGSQLGPQRRWRRRGGRLRDFLPFFPSRVFSPCSPVCTAGMDPSLTVWALEASGTETGGGAKPFHTGTTIEAWRWREEAVRGCISCL